ncbi:MULTISPECIES: S24 family peptidase [unclassified Paraburkholderia]|uniref:S24 family peptidase n=1 Tax=unclassified Paraburkholderia TaxID=2615204 RepID=UPI001610A1C9|nr:MULTISPECIES: S24 family peptidase [unclassified Paraburkholderia]MBB5444620.1 phage repressor protein C with HTH and peptisase S24 domain [Paraburkholderia sp. WSM4177]MBB5485444.1 phage repressor protein C with HTH and peptisase S24 domain [Paraburkholderia sp. WSM4180]
MADKPIKIEGVVSYFKERGVSITYEMVRRYTLGQAMPRQEKLRLLSDAVGARPEALVYGPSINENFGIGLNEGKENVKSPSKGGKSGLIDAPATLQAGKDDEIKTSGEPPLRDGRLSVSARPILAWDDASELGEEYVLIPRLEVKASAGNGRIAWHVDEKGQKQAFRKAWCSRLGIRPEQAATIVAEGSSMEPRVRDGDSLVVDYRATELMSGKVYVLSFQNEVFVKRVFKKPSGGLTIHSDNPDKGTYPDMEIDPSDVEHIEIIALVVAVSGAI